MAKYMAAALVNGCWINKVPGLLRIRTNREPEMVVDVKRAGAFTVAWVGRGLETVAAEDTAALCRWAVRLSVEMGKGVESNIKETT